MLSSHEIESLRRSNAMAPLSPSHVALLLDACDELVRQRAELTRLLDGLPQPFASVRTILNDIHRILGTVDPAPSRSVESRRGDVDR
jgi:hypothetical protein